MLLDLPLQLRDTPVLDFAGLAELAAALGLLELACARHRVAPAICALLLISAFSFCHWAVSWALFSRRSASSFSMRARRSRLAASFSFLSACRSISSCMICRSSSSISVGLESSSILRRDAASSIKSTALSGRKRSEM